MTPNPSCAEYPPGVRRSRREHIAPLDFWRGERVVYGRPDFSQVDPAKVLPIPQIREIIRIPKEPAQPLGKRKRGHPHRGRSKTAEPRPPNSKGRGTPASANLEEGWDDDTPSNAKVLDYRTGQEVERRIAWTAKMVNPQPVANNTWSFDKIFGDADFIASGQLVIPPGSRKPSKATKDNTYVGLTFCLRVTCFLPSSDLLRHRGCRQPQGPRDVSRSIHRRDVHGSPRYAFSLSQPQSLLISYLQATPTSSRTYPNATPSYSSRKRERR